MFHVSSAFKRLKVFHNTKYFVASNIQERINILCYVVIIKKRDIQVTN